jgi:hypothetical protein
VHSTSLVHRTILLFQPLAHYFPSPLLPPCSDPCRDFFLRQFGHFLGVNWFVRHTSGGVGQVCVRHFKSRRFVRNENSSFGVLVNPVVLQVVLFFVSYDFFLTIMPFVSLITCSEVRIDSCVGKVWNVHHVHKRLLALVE